MPLCDDNDPITLDVPTAEIKHPGQLHTEHPPAATGMWGETSGSEDEGKQTGSNQLWMHKLPSYTNFTSQYMKP